MYNNLFILILTKSLLHFQFLSYNNLDDWFVVENTFSRCATLKLLDNSLTYYKCYNCQMSL